MNWNRLKSFFINNSRFSVNILILVNLLLAGVAFIKDVLLARYFGTSHHGDSLYLAFFLPDTVGNNLLAATIGLSCIPLFTRASNADGAKMRTIYKIILITLILSILSLLLLVPSSNWLFTHVNQVLVLRETQMVQLYFYIMLPIVILSPISIIAVSILQASDQFIKPAFMPVIFNFILLLFIVISSTFNIPLEQGGSLFSVSILLSSFFVTVLSWTFVLKKTALPMLVRQNPISLYKEDNQDVRDFFKIFTPYFFILLSQQFIFLVERYIASTLEVGTVSGLTYAFRISQFPIWVFIAAINTVLLPTLSKLLNDKRKLKRELRKAFILVTTISFSVSIVFFIGNEWIISVLFLKGAFDFQSLQITSDIFKGFALSLLGQSMYLFCLRYFVANGKMLTPLLISLAGCGIHILFLILFVAKFGSSGIGYAAAIGYSLTGGLLFILLCKDLSKGNSKAVLSHE
jgi:putative peptidoglycan lipid II flippase